MMTYLKYQNPRIKRSHINCYDPCDLKMIKNPTIIVQFEGKRVGRNDQQHQRCRGRCSANAVLGERTINNMDAKGVVVQM